ncbi:MAG: leucine-rich repeat protein [Bacteroides sp.]|nr:leucine-rich repeat protein [Bacteroides sp.]
MKQYLKKLVMSIAMLLTLTSAYAYDFEVDGIYYEVTSFTDLTCKVVSGDNKYEGDVTIPSEVSFNSRTLRVTEIGDKAFYECSSLTSVVIPDSVTEIGDYAFSRCGSLTSVVIPDSVTVIGNSAFRNCSSLTSVVIGNSVTVIGDSAFRNCSSLTSVVIPDSVTEIWGYAFDGCSSLTSVVIPDSVTVIGSSAFYGCSSLTSLVIPDSVTKIWDSAFSGCSSLTSVIISDSVTVIEEYAFSRCSSLTSVVIPDSVTKIKSYAFKDCSSLTSVVIGNSVNEIESYAFYGCSSLTSLAIGNSVTYIKYDTFYGCSPLTSLAISYSTIELKIQYLVTSLSAIENLFIDRELDRRLSLPSLKELTLGEHVTEVQIYPTKSESLESIICYAKEPPTCPEFTNAQYLNTVVKVPTISLEKYKRADGWKNFWNLEGFDTGESAVNEVISDEMKTEIGRYDINGKSVDADYNGIVIVRYSDGSTMKILNK